MIRPRSAPVPLLWALLGVGAGLVGLVAAYGAEMFFTLHRPLMLVVASMGTRVVPEHAHEVAVKYLGLHDLGFFVFLLVLAGCLVCAWGGAGGRRGWWKPVAAYTVLAGVAGVAVATETPGRFSQYLCLGLGWLVAVGVFFALGALLRGALADRGLPEAASARVPEPATDAGPTGSSTRVLSSRRTLLGAVGVLAAATVAGGLGARGIGTRRRRTAAARALVRLPAMSRGVVPAGAQSEVAGATPWRTPNQTFFVRDTALRTPTVEPTTWGLRVHGLVQQEIYLTYADLVKLPITEQWVSLVCADNGVGGELAGTAWWTGVRMADVLNAAGIGQRADAVVQTSEDGWQCTTPLEVLLDSDALLAFGMNGEVLPIEHGFPVRTVVPGLVGDTSACKWLVDLEVIRAAPVVDQDPPEPRQVPWQARVDRVLVAGHRDSPVLAGDEVLLLGTLLGTDVTRASYEVAVDEGPWRAGQPLPVTGLPVGVWRQFEHRLTLSPGHHTVQVRAVSPNGRRSEPHEVDVEVTEPASPESAPLSE